MRLILTRPSTVLLLSSLAAAFLLSTTAAAQLADPTTAVPPVDPRFEDGGFFDTVDPLSPPMLVIEVAVGGLVLYLAFQFLGAKFVNSENVLENDARRTIFEFIKAHPGTHLRATANALELSTTNVLWHLRKLEGANLVASRKVEGYKIYYPTEGGVEARRLSLAMSVLRNGNARDILQYILANPGTHQREIARALGVNHGTVRWHLRKLGLVGLVLPMDREHMTHYYTSDLGTKALFALEPAGVVPTATATAVATVADDEEEAVLDDYGMGRGNAGA